MFPVSHTKRGFTLVELVLTIILIGIVSAVAVPRFFNQTTFDERFFYDDLLAASRYAGKLAIGSGCSVRLTIDSEGYALVQDQNCEIASPNFNLTVNRPDSDEAYVVSDDADTDNIPDSITLTTDESTLIFLPNHQVVDGSGNAISTATIQLSGERVRQIIIYGGSGYVQEG